MTDATPPAVVPRPTSTRWLTQRRAIGIVALVATVVHLIAAGSIPLILMPDSQEYIGYATQMLDGGSDWHIPYRVPGYPAILAVTFSIMGRSGAAILVLNHLLAIGTCVGIGWTAIRLAGPLSGMIAGLLLVFDPWYLTMSTYALTEIPTIAVVTGAAMIALLWRRNKVSVAVTLGVVLAAACLMRPSIQSLVPFMAGAWLLRIPASWKRRAALGVVVMASWLGASAPWLAFNASQGVYGFARGSNSQIWYGVGFWGMLDPAYPIDDKTRAIFNNYVGDLPSDDGLCQVMYQTNCLKDAAQDKLLGDWARDGIKKHPTRYAVAVCYSLLWQLNRGDPNFPPMWDELRFLARRPFGDGTRDAGPNFQGALRFPGYGAFLMGWRGGIFGPYLWWWGQGHLRGIPQIPLFLCAVVTVVAAGWRRQWGVAVFTLGTLVFLLAHCLLLMPITRYSLPASTLWYIPAAWVLHLVSTGIVSKIPPGWIAFAKTFRTPRSQ